MRRRAHMCSGSGWTHFMGNTSYLLLLGPMLEEKHSSKTLIPIIVITAFITGPVNYIFSTNVALCGAGSEAYCECPIYKKAIGNKEKILFLEVRI